MFNTDLLYDPTVPLLGISPREMRTYVHTKTRMLTVLAALLMIAKKWKSTHQLMNMDK